MAKIEVYSVDEVAEILKVTQRSVYTYIRSGQLKAAKIGKSWRITHSSLQEFIENGTKR